MAHGGERSGAGRPIGARNKRTVELEDRAKAAAAAIEAAIGEAFTGDAHAFLMAVYKNPAQPMEMRIEAAKAAIRYEKPALATVDLTTHGSVVHEICAEPLSPEERDKEWLAAHGTAH